MKRVCGFAEVLSYIFNAIWIFGMVPYALFSVLFLMGFDSVPRGRRDVFLTSAAVYTYMSVSFFMLLGVILSFYFNRRRRHTAAMLIQLLPIAVFGLAFVFDML